jgi:hypothetical protein
MLVLGDRLLNISLWNNRRIAGVQVFSRLGGWLRCLQILSDTGFGAHRGISTHG